MSYSNLPHKNDTSGSAQSSNTNSVSHSGKWKPKFSKTFWLACLGGIGLFLAGLALKSTFPSWKDGRLSLSEVIQIGGIILLVGVAPLMLFPNRNSENSSRNNFKLIYSRAYRFLTILLGLGLLLLLSGMVLEALTDSSYYWLLIPGFFFLAITISMLVLITKRQQRNRN